MHKFANPPVEQTAVEVDQQLRVELFADRTDTHAEIIVEQIWDPEHPQWWSSYSWRQENLSKWAFEVLVRARVTEWPDSRE